MARAYSSAAPAVTIATKIDIHVIQTTAGMVCEVDELDINQATQTTVSNQSISCKRFYNTYTIGTGGSAGGPKAHVFGDSANVCTTRYDDTAQITGSTST